jgi:alpha-2-macroglobulin
VTTLDLKEGDTIKSIPVAGDWGAGAYALVLAHRPLDKAAKRMPGRAIGLAWFAIDADAHALEVRLAAPAKARPRGVLSIPLEIKGLASGEEARVIWRRSMRASSISPITKHPIRVPISLASAN